MSVISKEQIEEKMIELASRLNYQYKDITYLAKAMYCNKIIKEEDGKNRDNYTNSALATLGDSVLGIVITELLYDNGYDKEDITDKKKKLVGNDTLSSICQKMKIYGYAYNDNYFAYDAPDHLKIPNPKHDLYVEAIIGAIYKDKGLNYTKKWIINFYNYNGICRINNN